MKDVIKGAFPDWKGAFFVAEEDVNFSKFEKILRFHAISKPLGLYLKKNMVKYW